MSTREAELLNLYKEELRFTLELQAEDLQTVHRRCTAPGVSRGRERVPVEEVIEHLRTAIAELEGGASAELWEF